MRIGIDLMGSDRSPTVIFDAVIQALEKLDPALKLTAIATPSVMQQLQEKASSHLSKDQLSRLSFFKANEVIDMHDDPLSALRLKKGSSIACGIRLLKKRQIDAFVSAGNTGALIASASISLPKLPGITRPALLAVLPTQTGSVAIVDVGGNVSSKSHHLLAYAYIGAAYQKCTANISIPKVGLLNIGRESKKGTSVVREAYQLLTEASNRESSERHPFMEFQGNIEGREVLKGKVDVLVTDGFAGNVLVKTSEGIADVIFDQLQDFLEKNPSPELKKLLSSMMSTFHYAEYQGALLCGIDALVIKCHGHSSARAIFNGIKGAVDMHSHKLLSQIKSHLTPGF